jgi:hypothetical protein
MDNITKRRMVVAVMIVTALNISAQRSWAQEQVLAHTTCSGSRQDFRLITETLGEFR